MQLLDLRRQYHQLVLRDIIRIHGDHAGFPNFADKMSEVSKRIAWGIVNRIGGSRNIGEITGQTAGGRFEETTRDFIQNSFNQLAHLRPGNWMYSTNMAVSSFYQYEHLAALKKIIAGNTELASTLGTDYIITPDIVIGRWPLADKDINERNEIIQPDQIIAELTPLRQKNIEKPFPILHASISCKWTLRSDRGQNSRTEALNLLRNRKGHLPHIVAVTAEPLPTRIASLALGTGDLDCVYHFALDELVAATKEVDNEGQMDMLHILIEGRRLRDISDLPFDLIA